ncbi:hypothetical protein P7C70_g7225, partial [Phenoliferia sp. Uapishka_3]
MEPRGTQTDPRLHLDQSYIPSLNTTAWLSSLPVPPGANAGSCIPRTVADWNLAEQWRVLIEAIEILGRAQRWRIEASRRKWDGRTQALLPLVDSLQLNETPDLGALVESHRSLREPTTSSSTDSADPTATAFSVPALFSAIQELEDSVMTLRLEVEEASSLQHNLESELELRTLSNSQRLAHLQSTITAQLTRQSSITGGASINEVQALVEQNADYERLRAQEVTSANRITANSEPITVCPAPVLT